MLYCAVVSVAGVTVAGVWHMWANASGQMQGEMCALQKNFNTVGTDTGIENQVECVCVHQRLVLALRAMGSSMFFTSFLNSPIRTRYRQTR